MPRELIHYFVTGRVQGVGFRQWTVKTAKSLGITGWVKNLSDGRVEVVAQGNLDALRQLEELTHEGPTSARVETVAVVKRGSAEDHGEDLSTFEIR